MEIATTTQCRNCGADTTGNFCHMCGQETRLHAPSFGEFLHEFVGHYVALEGRLWGTITRLLFRPGLLTNEYLAGRRKRYVEPLRLYLSLSILFFAIVKFGGADIANFDAQPVPPDVEARTQQVQAEKRAQRQQVQPGQENFEQMVEKKAPTVFAAFDRFDQLPAREKGQVLQTGFYKYAPYAIFLLMPLFALYLKVLYLGSGRRYGEHFLFALHTNAFAFITMGVFVFMPEGFIKFMLFCWMAGYLPWAMQRVYRKGKFGTAWRWILLMFLHSVSLGLAIVAAMGAGIMTAH